MLKKKYIKFKYICMAALATAMFACVDKDLDEDFSEDQHLTDDKAFVLSVNVTLDQMGGTRYDDMPEITRLQNYINPEKFRVLFFDKDDKFLFESKSRWVKIMEQDGEYISWKVSVPFFSYGNDYELDWDWNMIRWKLTHEKFKIALLVNRPDNEWYPAFKYTKWGGYDENGNAIANPDSARWFNNSGPHWKRFNSIAYKMYCDSTGTQPVGYPEVYDIFDLHHSQYDPIYEGKNVDNAGAKGYYSVVMGNHSQDGVEESYINGEPYMSSTSSWADWQGYGGPVAWNVRPTIMPSEEHPIPMYGVQTYEPVDPEKWLDGTTFVLDRPEDKGVALLRSVARVDLLIPDTYRLDYCMLYYVNPYARCEPMNVWTPTDSLWNNANHGYFANGQYHTYCDEEKLVKYGPITESSSLSQTQSKQKYWEKLAWLYGVWLQKKNVWNWGPKDTTWAQQIVDGVKASKGIDPPQIMNPCIQRLQRLVVVEDQNFKDVPGYHHYIAYIGERHTNAPSDLGDIGNTGSGNPTVLYWTFGVTNGDRYSVAIADYDNNYGNGYGYAAFRDVAGVYPANGYGNTYPDNPGNNMGIQGGSHGSGFMPAYQNGTGPGPLPIIRNHIYKLTLVKTGTRSNGSPEFEVRQEIKKSPSIDFTRRVNVNYGTPANVKR